MKNRSKIFVIPDEEEIITKFSGKRTIIYTDSLSKTREIMHKIKRNSELICIRVDSEKNLSDIEFSDEDRDIPVALFVPEVGDLLDVLLKINLLKALNMQIFLPVENHENIRSLRILSSSGVNCGFYIDDNNADINWEEIDDLFYYYAYTQTRKGGIEPFRYIISKDIRKDNFDFRVAFFQGDKEYVYIDRNLNYASNYKDLKSGIYEGQGYEEIEAFSAISDNDENIKPEMFIDNDTCTYCSSYPICRSAYLGQCQKNNEYKTLFESITEYIYNISAKSDKGTKAKWQL